jgi:hypothetical protein
MYHMYSMARFPFAAARTWWWFCSKMPIVSAAAVRAATCSGVAAGAAGSCEMEGPSAELLILLLVPGVLGLLLLEGPVGRKEAVEAGSVRHELGQPKRSSLAVTQHPL